MPVTGEAVQTVDPLSCVFSPVGAITTAGLRGLISPPSNLLPLFFLLYQRLFKPHKPASEASHRDTGFVGASRDATCTISKLPPLEVLTDTTSGADLDHRIRGSRLEADHPDTGVIFACWFTVAA